MSIFDRKTYEDSTIDWDGLRQLAKRAAEETFESHTHDYWVLQQRSYYREEEYNDGTRISEEYQDTIEYCLGADGKLFVRTTCVRERYYFHMQPLVDRNTYDNPMNDTDVINFDFEPQLYWDRTGKVYISTNRNPGDKLLYPTKGAGLKAQLMRLLEKSFVNFIKPANQGDEKAQYYVGESYYLGKGVNQDYNQAIEWYTKAAEQNNTTAQCKLGDLYFNGSGVSQDYKQAIEWYTKAANLGSAAAQNRLGYCFFHGKYFDQNYQRAVDWYKKAANQGNADAQCVLGECYQQGYGTIQDNGKAIEWYTKATNQGNVFARGELNKLNRLIQEQKEKQKEKEKQDLERKKREEEELERKEKKKQNTIFTAVFWGVTFIFTVWLFFSVFPGGSAYNFYRWIYNPNGNIPNFISSYIKKFLPIILFTPTIFIVMFKINKDILINNHKIIWSIKYMPVLWMIGISAYFIFAGSTGINDIAFVISFGLLGIPMLFTFLLFLCNTIFAIIMTILNKKSFRDTFGSSGCLLSLTVIPMFFIGYLINPHIFDDGGYWIVLLCAGLSGFILNWIVDQFRYKK